MKILVSIYLYAYTYLGTSSPPSNYYYYDYYSPTRIYDLNCTGIENNIWDCPYCPYDDHYHFCSYYQDAAVICQCMYTIIICQQYCYHIFH